MGSWGRMVTIFPEKLHSPFPTPFFFTLFHHNCEPSVRRYPSSESSASQRRAPKPACLQEGRGSFTTSARSASGIRSPKSITTTRPSIRLSAATHCVSDKLKGSYVSAMLPIIDAVVLDCTGGFGGH